jgi:tetratricopeptide (TPR) repeat protein
MNVHFLKIKNFSFSFQWKLHLLCTFLFTIIIHAADADPASEFKKGNDYYQKQDFENAIKTYEGLIKNGNASAEVYYNLGNSYFKTDNIAHAMINYERAKKILPDDDDINFNIKIASLK